MKADEEIKAAAAYYESVQTGLGEAFLQALAESFKQVQKHPLAWSIFDADIRRYLMHRFPYGIVYRVEEDRIFIIAVMHLHRRPRYWQDRSQIH